MLVAAVARARFANCSVARPAPSLDVDALHLIVAAGRFNLMALRQCCGDGLADGSLGTDEQQLHGLTSRKSRSSIGPGYPAAVGSGWAAFQSATTSATRRKVASAAFMCPMRSCRIVMRPPRPMTCGWNVMQKTPSGSSSSM